MSTQENNINTVVYMYDINTLGHKITKFTEVNFSTVADSDLPIFEHRCSILALYLLTLELQKKDKNSGITRDYMTSPTGLKQYQEFLQLAVNTLDNNLTREKLARFQKSVREQL